MKREKKEGNRRQRGAWGAEEKKEIAVEVGKGMGKERQ